MLAFSKFSDTSCSLNLKLVRKIPFGLRAESISEKIDKMVAKQTNLETLLWLQKVLHLRSKNRDPEHIEYAPHNVTILCNISKA